MSPKGEQNACMFYICHDIICAQFPSFDTYEQESSSIAVLSWVCVSSTLLASWGTQSLGLTSSWSSVWYENRQNMLYAGLLLSGQRSHLNLWYIQATINPQQNCGTVQPNGPNSTNPPPPTHTQTCLHIYTELLSYHHFHTHRSVLLVLSILVFRFNSYVRIVSHHTAFLFIH